MAPEKCCYTIFSKTANSKFRFDLKFYDKCIPYSQENKFLGVVLDESLCFTKNTDALIKKSRSRLNIVKNTLAQILAFVGASFIKHLQMFSEIHI